MFVFTTPPRLACRTSLTTTTNTHRVRYSSSPIAEGGFSFVYRATDSSTGEHYALKKILCQVRLYCRTRRLKANTTCTSPYRVTMLLVILLVRECCSRWPRYVPYRVMSSVVRRRYGHSLECTSRINTVQIADRHGEFHN